MNEFPNVLALDLASTVGYAYNLEGEIYTGFKAFTRKTGRKTIEDEHPGKKYGNFIVWLYRQLEAIKPVHVIYEEPAMFQSKSANDMAGGLRGITLGLCGNKNIQVSHIYPNQLKLFATGSGKSKKPQVIKACQDRLGSKIEDDNEADARWLLEYHLTSLNGGVMPNDKLSLNL